jgi:hypothetical protein
MRFFQYIVFYFFCAGSAFSQDAPFNLNIMEVMEDAEYRKINYRALINFKSPLTAQKATPYLFDKDKNELISLGELRLNKLQSIAIDFTYFNRDNLYLIFLLDEVGFNFNDIRPAQMTCFTPIKNDYLATVVDCNFATTATYMMALDQNHQDLINVQSINKWIELMDEDIFNTQTFQNFVGMFNVGMTYLVRYPKHLSLDMLNTGFIKIYSTIVQDYLLRISARYSADITSYEKILNRISNAYANFGYQVDKDKTLLFQTALTGLPLAKTHTIYLNDFFTGAKDLNFINKSAYRLAGLTYDKSSRTLRWLKWPWMKHVVVTIEGEEEVIITNNEYTLPETFDKLTLVPFGTRGKFIKAVFTPQSIIGISQ